jgi:hypothetical protein
LNNSKIILSKTPSAIFLAIVLVTGTIAAISPSFIIKGVNAQGEPYYGGGMDNSYYDKKSYGMDDSYGYPDYRDDKKRYDDSYGPTDYRDNKDRKSYDKKPYGNDNGYESQYQPSYKPNYKPVKDDKRDKSKDSNKSVSLNKIKCINTNLNINGNNAGNVSIGNKGQGYLGTYSSDGSGGYGDKQGKGFDDCIINNNNTNTNVAGGGGNVTTPLTCEECFNANLTLAGIITDILELPGGISLFPVFPDISIGGNVMTIAQLCDFFEEQISEGNIPQTGLIDVINAILNRDTEISAFASEESIEALYECLLDVDFG